MAEEIQVKTREESVEYSIDRLNEICPSLLKLYPELQEALEVLFGRAYLDGQTFEVKQMNTALIKVIKKEGDNND